MSLYNRLRENSSDLYHSLMNIQTAVEPLLERPVHTYYTDHSVEHSQRIIGKLDGLTEAIMASSTPLSAAEIYVMLAAAYTHDIGMQDEQSVNGDLNEARRKHHELAEDIILRSIRQPEKAVSLNITNEPDIINAVALVAKGHRQIDIEHDPDYEDFDLGDEPVRIRLLAALLRLADELDIDYRRVQMHRLNLMEVPTESQLHWYKCYYVSGVKIQNGYVIVHYRFPQADQCRHYERIITKLVHPKLEATCAQLRAIFREYGFQITIDDPHIRKIPTLIPMPPEVEALAREECETWYDHEITRLRQEADDLPSLPSPNNPLALEAA